jgi:hypothetical protein
MQRFQANTQILNRYLLREEIEIDPAMTFQIWGVVDIQNQQKLIGKFWQDGRVEWFNDNRIITPPTPQIQENKSLFSNKNPQKTKRIIVRVTLGLLLISLLVLGYIKRKNITTFYDEKIASNKSITPVNSDFEPVQINSATPEQAAQKLESLKNINPDQHQKLFDNARVIFSQLKKNNPESNLIDDFLETYLEKGEATLKTHEQNGDRVSLEYAIAWFRLAYALNPSVDIEEKINQLKGGIARRKTAKNIGTKTANANESQPLFMPDPEIHESNEKEDENE